MHFHPLCYIKGLLHDDFYIGTGLAEFMKNQVHPMREAGFVSVNISFM